MRTIGAVLFDGFEMLDLYGPLEMFGSFPNDFRITTVAEIAGPLKASGGPQTIGEASFSDSTHYDILLVPGGAGTRREGHNPVMLEWLGNAGAKAEIVASVCTGSVLLARAGLLEGRRATTNKRAFQWVVDQTSGVFWQRRARWVEDGNLFTSSGVSAGMDMSLALIERLLGTRAAEDAARWAEYNWNRDPDDDPFAGEDE